MNGPQMDADLGGGGKEQNDGNNFNSSVSKASKVANDFLNEVKGVEKGLLEENVQLQSQIAGYELAVSALSNQVNSLKEELANQPDCDEDDGYAMSETPEEMAGEAPRRSTSGNRQATLD